MKAHSNARMYAVRPSEIFPIRTVSFWSANLIAAGFDYAMTARLLLSRETTFSVNGAEGP